MKRLRGVVALALTAVATACAHTDTPPDKTVTIEVSYDDLLQHNTISRQTALRTGDTLTVLLGANPSTGYLWAAQMDIGDDAVLTQTGHRIVAPTAGQSGAPGSEEWTFQAMAPGQATVTTTYGQPWPGGQQKVWTFSAEVSVS